MTRFIHDSYLIIKKYVSKENIAFLYIVLEPTELHKLPKEVKKIKKKKFLTRIISKKPICCKGDHIPSCIEINLDFSVLRDNSIYLEPLNNSLCSLE